MACNCTTKKLPCKRRSFIHTVHLLNTPDGSIAYTLLKSIAQEQQEQDA